MIPTKDSRGSFPLTKLPFKIIENIIRNSIINTSSTLTGSQLIFVNRLFARTSIPYIWKHLYLREPTQRLIFNVLSTSPEELTFDYKSFVQSITICPVSISHMSKGGLLKTLETVQNLLPPQSLDGISIEDKLSFCHVCHVGKEITFKQVATQLLVWKGLKEFALNSDHSAFNDDLLGELLPNFAPFINRHKGIHGGLVKLCLSGPNFTDQGILQHVIPHVKDTLIEFSAGYDGENPADNITGFSILELLKSCKKLEKVYLNGVSLNDSDFIKMTNDDDGIGDYYCEDLLDDILDDNLSDFEDDYDSSSSNNSLIIPRPSQTTWVPSQQRMYSQLKYLYIGKTNQSTFTHTGLLSLLSLCHKTLHTLVMDLDHISQSVLLEGFIPLFSCSKLQEIYLVSESCHEWALYYPRPRYEFEIQAKEAMWRWKLKVYWGLSKELIEEVGNKIESLRVFSILGENYLYKEKVKRSNVF